MNAQQFLTRVEQTGMVSEPLLEELRSRIADSKRAVRPEMLAKLLVDRGELTAAQARKLIAFDDVETTPAPQPPKAPEPELTLATEAEHLLDDDTELQLVEDEPETVEPEAELDLLVEEEEPEAILIDDEDDLLADTTPMSPPSSRDSSSAVPPLPPGPPQEVADILADPLGDTFESAPGTKLAPRRRGLAGLFQGLIPSRRGPQKKRWDSPLILVGIFALAILCAAAVAFLGLFRSESADEVFQAAEDAYRSRSYGQAISNYEKFVSGYPENENASLSRVRIELAKLRQITEGSKNWEDALNAAQQRLPTIEPEASFDAARDELTGLLPGITEGLVEQAKAANNSDEKERVANLATEALGLVNNPVYLPTSKRKSQEARIDDLDEAISIIRRDIATDRELTSTLVKIAAAAEASNIVEAYALRDGLIDKFPILEDDPRLRDTLAKVASQERAAVKVGPSSLAPLTDDHPTPSRASVVLSDQRGKPIPGVGEHVICILVRGSVYGIDASSGDTLWRRYVGYETGVFPQATNTRMGSDYLLVDAMRGEVLRVSARTGNLVWRLPCPGPIATPQVVADRVLITCGRDTEAVLLAVDVNTGNVLNQVEFPVGCVAPVAVDPERKEVVQFGAHSSVYVLDLETLACKSVISLGHARESIQVGPSLVGGFLLIAETIGSDTSLLHVYRSTTDGTWGPTGDPIRLAGQVMVPVATDERRALVMTDTGELQVFEAPLDASELRKIAGRKAGSSSVGLSFPLLDRSNIWLADRTFSRLELQATRGQLVQKWLRNADDRFLGPLQRHGDYVFHVRQRVGMLGATVAATQIALGDDDGRSVWETDVGVPCDVLVDSQGSVSAMTFNGALFPIDSDAVRQGITNRAAARMDPSLLPKAFGQNLRMSEDAVIFAGPPPIDQYIQADLRERSLRLVPVLLDADEISAELVKFGDSLLAASDSGPIHVLTTDTGKSSMSPFLPRVQPGSRIEWLRPASIGNDRQFIAAERSGRIYRVASDGKLLTMLASTKVETTISAGLASAGQAVFAVIRDTDGTELITQIEPQGLTLGKQTSLRDGLAWGPCRVGDVVFVSDMAGSVYCFGGDGNLKWQIDETAGPLAGPPLSLGERFVFAFNPGDGRSTNSEVWVVDAAGKVRGKTMLSEPLGSGPVGVGGKLLLSGWDGTLYLIDVPQ